jgi:hypothetical protein
MDDCLRRARSTNSVEWTGREEEKGQKKMMCK